jgi:hypothetical protein
MGVAAGGDPLTSPPFVGTLTPADGRARHV